MEFERTERFKSDYDSLPAELKERTKKALALFADNPKHPSLQAEKLKGHRNIWKARVTESHRFTYSMKKGNICVLRRVGPHEIENTP